MLKEDDVVLLGVNAAETHLGHGLDRSL
jgi:hypothetical protein